MLRYSLVGKRGALIGTFEFRFGARSNGHVDLDALAMDWARKQLELKRTEVTAEAFRSRGVMLIRVFLQHGLIESHRSVLFPPLNLHTATRNELRGCGKLHPKPFLDQATGQVLPYLELASDFSIVGRDGRTVQAVAGDYITRTVPRGGCESYVFNHVPRAQSHQLIPMGKRMSF